MKRALFFASIFLLSACNLTPNNETQYKELVYTYFETSDCASNYDVIRITVEDMESDEIIARASLLLDEIDSDITIKIYQYETMIPSIITLKKIDGEISGLTFNTRQDTIAKGD